MTGTKERVFEVSAPLSLLAFKTEHLLVSYPGLAALLDRCLFALDLDYVEPSQEAHTLLDHSCELAVLPPVSGG